MNPLSKMRRGKQEWCPYCSAPPGPDCPVKVYNGKQLRLRLRRELVTQQGEQ